jgi:hypothetical protein
LISKPPLDLRGSIAKFDYDRNLQRKNCTSSTRYVLHIRFKSKFCNETPVDLFLDAHAKAPSQITLDLSSIPSFLAEKTIG